MNVVKQRAGESVWDTYRVNENGPGVSAENTDVNPGPRPQQHHLED